MARRLMGAPRSPYSSSVPVVQPEDEAASQMFDEFVAANTFQGIMGCFQQLCDLLQMKVTLVSSPPLPNAATDRCLSLLQPTGHQVFYKQLKTRLTSWKAQSFWTKLDKRAANREYKKGTACSNTRVSTLPAPSLSNLLTRCYTKADVK